MEYSRFFDRIQWSKKTYTLRMLLGFRRLPCIVSVPDGHQGSNEVENIPPGMILRIHSVFAERRVFARSVDGRVFSIPETFPIKFEVIKKNEKREKAKRLNEILRNYRPPIAVTLDRKNSRWNFRNGKTVQSEDTIGSLVLFKGYFEHFVRASQLVDGAIDRHVFLVPLYMDLDVLVAEGLKDADPSDFQNLMKMYDDAVKRVDYSSYTSLNAILVFDPSVGSVHPLAASDRLSSRTSSTPGILPLDSATPTVRGSETSGSQAQRGRARSETRQRRAFSEDLLGTLTLQRERNHLAVAQMRSDLPPPPPPPDDAVLEESSRDRRTGASRTGTHGLNRRRGKSTEELQTGTMSRRATTPKAGGSASLDGWVDDSRPRKTDRRPEARNDDVRRTPENSSGTGIGDGTGRIDSPVFRGRLESSAAEFPSEVGTPASRRSAESRSRFAMKKPPATDETSSANGRGANSVMDGPPVPKPGEPGSSRNSVDSYVSVTQYDHVRHPVEAIEVSPIQTGPVQRAPTERDPRRRAPTERDPRRRDSTERDSRRRDSTERDSRRRDSTERDPRRRDSTERDPRRRATTIEGADDLLPLYQSDPNYYVNINIHSPKDTAHLQERQQQQKRQRQLQQQHESLSFESRVKTSSGNSASQRQRNELNSSITNPPFTTRPPKKHGRRDSESDANTANDWNLPEMQRSMSDDRRSRRVLSPTKFQNLDNSTGPTERHDQTGAFPVTPYSPVEFPVYRMNNFTDQVSNRAERPYQSRLYSRVIVLRDLKEPEVSDREIDMLYAGKTERQRTSVSGPNRRTETSPRKYTDMTTDERDENNNNPRVAPPVERVYDTLTNSAWNGDTKSTAPTPSRSVRRQSLGTTRIEVSLPNPTTYGISLAENRRTIERSGARGKRRWILREAKSRSLTPVDVVPLRQYVGTTVNVV